MEAWSSELQTLQHTKHLLSGLYGDAVALRKHNKGEKIDSQSVWDVRKSIQYKKVDSQGVWDVGKSI